MHKNKVWVGPGNGEGKGEIVVQLIFMTFYFDLQNYFIKQYLK